MGKMEKNGGKKGKNGDKKAYGIGPLFIFISLSPISKYPQVDRCTSVLLEILL